MHLGVGRKPRVKRFYVTEISGAGQPSFFDTDDQVIFSVNERIAERGFGSTSNDAKLKRGGRESRLQLFPGFGKLFATLSPGQIEQDVVLKSTGELSAQVGWSKHDHAAVLPGFVFAMFGEHAAYNEISKAMANE